MNKGIEVDLEELPGIKTAFAIFPERKAIVTYDPASVAIKESGEPYDAVILDLTNNVGIGGRGGSHPLNILPS